MTSLETYLFAAENSHSKESIINNKLIYDLKLAAARHDYFLNVYTPEVDKDGFDMIFDDHDQLRKVQLKTVMKGASTNNWNIHKSALRPTPYTCEKLGFECSPSGTGYEGGIILIELEDSEENGFQVTYYYTDIIILCGLRDQIIDAIDKPVSKAIKTLTRSLTEGLSNEKIYIYKNMFLQAKDPACLLALMGIHNNIGTTAFRYHILQLAEPCVPDSLPSPVDKLKDLVNQELQKLSPSISPSV